VQHIRAINRVETTAEFRAIRWPTRCHDIQQNRSLNVGHSRILTPPGNRRKTISLRITRLPRPTRHTHREPRNMLPGSARDLQRFAVSRQHLSQCLKDGLPVAFGGGTVLGIGHVVVPFNAGVELAAK
jgi:hypothetical protein